MQGLQTDYVSPVMGFDINFRNKVIVVSDMDFIILRLEKKKKLLPGLFTSAVQTPPSQAKVFLSQLFFCVRCVRELKKKPK